jgi:P27 family predicted phage terminase small subunit
VQWDIVIREYLALGLINTVDLPSLTIYCAAWDDWLEAKKELSEMDEKYFTTESGYQQIRPQVTIMEKSKNTIDKFGSMFGFNPVSRSRIGMGGKKQEKDDFSKLYD